MKIDWDLYLSSPSYREAVDQSIRKEGRNEGLQYLRNSMEKADAWQGNGLSSCFVERAETEQQRRQSVRRAIDAVAKATEDTHPEVSIAMDALGMLLAENLTEVAAKTVAIVGKAQRLP